MKVAVATIVGLLTLALTPTAAFAGDGPWSDSVSSPCSPAISGKTGGGFGVAHITYDAHRVTLQEYAIDFGRSWVDGFQICSSGTSVTPYQVTVSQQYQFYGKSLTCSGGIDVSFPRNAGFNVSCSVSGSTVTETTTATCTVYAGSCEIDLGYLEVLAPAGATFSNFVYGRTTAVVTNGTGSIVRWQTHWK